MKMKWKSHARIHKECLSCTQLLEGSSTKGRVITPLLDKFISHHMKRWQPNWVPQQNSLPSTLLFIRTSGRLYLPGWIHHWGKNGWIFADLGEIWLGNHNLTHRGVFQTHVFHSSRSGQLFHPSRDASKTTHKRPKVWSQTDSVKWAHKTGPKSLFSIGSRILSVKMSDSPDRHKSLREHCWRKGTATFISTHPSDLTLVPASSFIMKRESSALSSSSSS